MEREIMSRSSRFRQYIELCLRGLCVLTLSRLLLLLCWPLLAIVVKGTAPLSRSEVLHVCLELSVYIVGTLALVVLFRRISQGSTYAQSEVRCQSGLVGLVSAFVHPKVADGKVRWCRPAACVVRSCAELLLLMYLSVSLLALAAPSDVLRTTSAAQRLAEVAQLMALLYMFLDAMSHTFALRVRSSGSAP